MEYLVFYFQSHQFVAFSMDHSVRNQSECFLGKAWLWESTDNNPSDIFVAQLVLARVLSLAELGPIRSQISLPVINIKALPSVSSSESKVSTQYI